MLSATPRDNAWLRLNLPEVPEVRIGGEIITCRGDVFFNSDKGEALYRFRLPSTLLGAKAIFIPRKTRGRSMYTMPGSSDAVKKKIRV